MEEPIVSDYAKYQKPWYEKNGKYRAKIRLTLKKYNIPVETKYLNCKNEQELISLLIESYGPEHILESILSHELKYKRRNGE